MRTLRRPFLGVGWKFPLQVTPRGAIALSSEEQKIEESILLILSTAPGERLMLPDFGCGIHDLVFATNSADTAGRVVTEVREALILWEPRIDLLNVQAGSDPGERSRLLIEIEYRVRTTNSRFNLVYPFYLV
jgi:phage baseplate assembly protein W